MSTALPGPDGVAGPSSTVAQTQDDADCLTCRLIGGTVLTTFGAQLTWEGRKHFLLARRGGGRGLGALAMGGMGVGMIAVGLHRWFSPYWRRRPGAMALKEGA